LVLILEIIGGHGLTGHSYADDTQSYDHCRISQLPGMISRFQDCFTELASWMGSNRLNLNEDKTEVILFGSKNSLSQIDITSIILGSTAINLSSSVRCLGVTLDSELTLKQHVSKLTSSCFYQMRELWQIRPYLDNKSVEILVHAFISSRLDYCNVILAGCCKTVLQPLQLVQNAAIRLVSCTRKRDHVSPLFLDLHWLRIRERCEYKVALLVFRCLHGQAPPYLTSGLTRVCDVHGRSQLRSAAKGDLLIPRITTKTYGPKSFYVKGPEVWNGLPPQVRDITSQESFKTCLKTFLFQRYD